MPIELESDSISGWNRTKNKKIINQSENELNQFQVLQSILNMGPSDEDPDGMYTGLPRDEFAVPVQDSDDL